MWVALVVILFLGGGAVLLFVPGAPGKTAAGLSAVLASLALTWKGIGTPLGRLAGQLEVPLWGAEVDGAVTEAITLGIEASPKNAPSVWQRRRQVTTHDYAGRAMRLPGVDPPSRPSSARP